MVNLMSLDFRVPFVAGKINFSGAIRGLVGMPRRLLLIGHKLSTGSLAENTLSTISSEADAIAKLGEGSMLLAMWRGAKANKAQGLPLDVLVLEEEETAVKATATVTLAGSPTASGEAALRVGGIRVAVGVSSGDTVASIATKLVAAVNAKTVMPVTAAAAAGVITLTAKWGGLTGNQIDVRTLYYADEALPPGLTAVVAPMSGGATSPDVSPAIVAMNLYRATEIVSAFTDSASMTPFEADLAARWEFNNMQDGMLCVAVRGTEGALTTWLNARNSPHVHTICVTADCTSPWETAAMAGAAIESSAATDPAAGPTATLLGYMGPVQGKELASDALGNLINKGGSVLAIAADYTGSLLRVVTNYKTTASGAPDRSMAELCWLKTMSYYRWFQVNTFQTKYNNKGYKLGLYVADPEPGQTIMTEDLAEEIMIGIYDQFITAGLCQNAEYYASTVAVEIDAVNQKLRITDNPVILTQYYQTEITSNVIAGQV